MQTPELTKKCSICFGVDTFKSPYPSSGAESYSKKLYMNYILECKTCGFGEVSPMVTEESLSNFYSDGDYWIKVKPNPLLQIHNKNQDLYRVKTIQPFLKNSKDLNETFVLDIGAGSGNIADSLNSELPNLKISYNFYEPDQERAEEISEKKFKNVKINYIDFPNNHSKKYDIIFANHVLEHVTNPLIFLEKIYNSLKPGGIAYIEVPNRDDRVKPNVFPHTLFFSMDSFTFLQKRLNWNSVTCQSFGQEVFNNSSLLFRSFGKILSKLYYLSIKLKLYSLARFLDIFMYQYPIQNKNGPWIKWVIKK